MEERISDIEDRIEERNIQEKKMLNLKIFCQKIKGTLEHYEKTKSRKNSKRERSIPIQKHGNIFNKII